MWSDYKLCFLCSVASCRAVKLRQLSVGAFLRINTVVILLGDVIRGQSVGVSSRNVGV